MKWLLVGGEGFIGQNLQQALRLEGHEYWIVDRQCGTEGMDITSGQLSEFDVIVNLAAVSGIPACDESPTTSFLDNVALPYHLMNLLPEGAQLLHFASQAALKDFPDSLYGAQKRCTAQLLEDMVELRGRVGDLTIVYPSNVYGPHSIHKTSAVAHWIQEALLKRPIVVHGDGSRERDFIYVRDVCADLIKCVSWEPDARGVLYPITGKATTINEVASRIGERLGADVVHVTDPRASEEDPYIKPDYMWNKRTKLDVGLDMTIKWYEENF